MSTENPTESVDQQDAESPDDGLEQGPGSEVAKAKAVKPAADKPKVSETNKVLRLLEKNPLGMTLPEMAGGARQTKKIKTLRPMLADAIRQGLVMPVSQRAGNTVYRLVKFLGPR